MTDAGDHEVGLEAVALLARRPCVVCEGRGDRVSDDWEAFRLWDQRVNRPALLGSSEAEEYYFLEVCDYGSVPPMRQPCGACEATGAVDTVVPMEALVAFVLERVRHPVLTAEQLEGIVGPVRLAITNAAQMSQGLADGLEMGTYLRAVQEGAEALRALGELQPQGKDLWDV